MKQLTLHIDEQQYETFLSFLKTLAYIKIEEEKAIPAWQESEVTKRLEQIEGGEMTVRSWDEAKKDLFQ